MRKVHPNDLKPDWRDPEMPVWWPLKDTRTGATVLIELQPWEAQQMMQEQFRESNAPNWRNDPTYDLAKRRRRR